jgi:radical SAM protein with 4Fe4S-binding SPASM domain
MKTIDLLKSRFITHSPVRLMHDVTYQCNCTCSICNKWKSAPQQKNELKLDAIISMLDDARKAGIINYVAVGGEPLLRADFFEIITYAKKRDFITSIVTNGYYLQERYDELEPYTDSLVVSIDSHDERHDKMRGVNGLKKRAIEGIKTWKQGTTSITINSVLCSYNYDAVEGLVDLSSELGVPILFQLMGRCEGYNENLILDQQQIHDTFLQIIKLKKEGYNIENSYDYLYSIAEKKPFICHAPKYMIHVEANGDIISCIDIIYKKWGNVKDIRFNTIFSSQAFKSYSKQVEHCNECPVTCVVEGSFLYSLNPFYLIDGAVSNRFHILSQKHKTGQ